MGIGGTIKNNKTEEEEMRTGHRDGAAMVTAAAQTNFEFFVQQKR